MLRNTQRAGYTPDLAGHIAVYGDIGPRDELLADHGIVDMDRSTSSHNVAMDRRIHGNGPAGEIDIFEYGAINDHRVSVFDDHPKGHRKDKKKQECRDEYTHILQFLIIANERDAVILFQRPIIDKFYVTTLVDYLADKFIHRIGDAPRILFGRVIAKDPVRSIATAGGKAETFFHDKQAAIFLHRCCPGLGHAYTEPFVSRRSLEQTQHRMLLLALPLCHAELYRTLQFRFSGMQVVAVGIAGDPGVVVGMLFEMTEYFFGTEYEYGQGVADQDARKLLVHIMQEFVPDDLLSLPGVSETRYPLGLFIHIGEYL